MLIILQLARPPCTVLDSARAHKVSRVDVGQFLDGKPPRNTSYTQWDMGLFTSSAKLLCAIQKLLPLLPLVSDHSAALAYFPRGVVSLKQSSQNASD